MKLSDFGFTEGINEIIAITRGVSDAGELNAAPIGIIVEDASSRVARARLFPSHTKENVENGSPLWANICFDAVLFVISAFEDPGEEFYASLNPPVLKGAVVCCRFDVEMDGGTAKLELAEGTVIERPLRAVNRGFNAVIEATVHATRYAMGVKNLEEKIRYYGTIVEKCGGSREKEAYKLLLDYIRLK
ncbi:DUF447 domain-containing protein [Archaeoglobus veneficus]|uniref:DUF447 family protein n=1 Tax=Archaeoglobus veneficus (strain DSM 11195 / SNP6) TaxID=693661 RepID=F2KML0_ARCVS|nr:DUF447 domain-containing protein [Archaeoglobus veneficus]AEA47207.1 protein of unknown function DUF447 [Archaeoglobus veneficus SNP6]